MTSYRRSVFVTSLAWIFIVLAGLASIISILQNIVLFAMIPPDKDCRSDEEISTP